jgi:hypothetical protein
MRRGGPAVRAAICRRWEVTRSLELRKSLPRRPSPESLSSSLHDRMKFAAGGTIPIQGAQWFVANMLTPRAERLG